MQIFNNYNAKIYLWEMCTKDISILIFLLISMSSNKNHKRVFMLKDTVIFQLSEQKSNPRSMMKENVSYR